MEDCTVRKSRKVKKRIIGQGHIQEANERAKKRGERKRRARWRDKGKDSKWKRGAVG